MKQLLMLSELSKSIWIDSVKSTKVFLLNIEEISCSEFDAAYFLMSDERKKRCDAYNRETDKKLCIAADMLIRRVLSEITGIDSKAVCISTTDTGKPYLENGDCYFSVSHSGNTVAAAFSTEYSVGIDIEQLRPVKAAVAKHIFTREDMFFVFGNEISVGVTISDPEVIERFFRVWTYKEAVVKMTGEGIDDNIKNFSYSPDKCSCVISDGYCITTVVQNKF